MIYFFIVISILAIVLYFKELSKRKKLEKDYSTVNKAYTKAITENMESSEKLSCIMQEYTKQKDTAKEIKLLHEKSRILKHDMKNHILVITSYLNSSQYDEAKKYTSDILDNLNKMYTYIQTGNSLLNYIINTKLQIAKSSGLNVKAEIENLSFEYIGSVDFSALLNNLLDNAIEGSLASENKELIINILRKKGYDTISIKNSINGSILKNNPKLISTKTGEGHGYGLTQIKRIVEKYNGMLDVYEEQNYFCVNVVYPIASICNTPI